jgi:hypothetical protein
VVDVAPDWVDVVDVAPDWDDVVEVPAPGATVVEVPASGSEGPSTAIDGDVTSGEVMGDTWVDDVDSPSSPPDRAVPDDPRLSLEDCPERVLSPSPFEFSPCPFEEDEPADRRFDVDVPGDVVATASGDMAPVPGDTPVKDLATGWSAHTWGFGGAAGGLATKAVIKAAATLTAAMTTRRWRLVPRPREPRSCGAPT